MDTWKERTLILGLSATAGSLDSWSYFGLAHVFIANMTGNTIMLGYSLATRDWVRASGAAEAIACYAGGVYAGTLLSRSVRSQAVPAAPEGSVVWPQRVSLILALELLLVLLAASLSASALAAQDGLRAHALVGIGAVAIGVQSAAIASLKLPGIVTTYITGTWTTLVSGTALRLAGEKEARGNGREQQLLLQAIVLLTYGSSAAGAGLVMRLAGRGAMGWLPAALLTLVVLGAFAWKNGPRMVQKSS